MTAVENVGDQTAPLQSSMDRILVIRGGAIGDFILTLPALQALRDAHPQACIEILGYRHIAELVNNRFYANQVRSIEYAPLARFFAKGAELSPELADYFASFDLVLSYLYDPDRIFENNLRRCGVEEIIRGPAKIAGHAHATRQLAEPMEELGLAVADFRARFYPSTADQEFARSFLQGLPRPIVAMHPGSGSESKNWPLKNWLDLGNDFLDSKKFTGSIVVVSGEADQKQSELLESAWSNARVRFAKNLALPELGALLGATTFLGHDSGISHLAAAAGANCVLLFGPTDPEIWAPLGENVRIIGAADGDLRTIGLETVREALEPALSG